MQVLIRLSVDDSILSSSSHQHLIRQCFATLLNSLEQRSVDIMVSLRAFGILWIISKPFVSRTKD